jgi:peptide/nickel transport system substrate-binding protein
VPLISTYYFFLNTQTPPFDNAEVRRAVHTGLDKAALIRAGGAPMRPGCTLLPPEIAGVRASEPCPFGTDRARAQEMIRAAGASGAAVTVYGNTEPFTKAVVEEFAGQLRAMGLNATTKLVSGERYFQTIGRDAERPQAGFANWFADYPHPGNFLFLVDPDTNQPTNNLNHARVSDPEMKAALDQGRYADADRRAVEQAYVVPWGHRDQLVVHKPQVPAGCVESHPLFGLDYTRLCRG